MPLIYSIIAPLIIISSVAVYQGEAFTAIETARLLQNCMLIAATSICLGVGVTQVDGFFNELPSFIGDIFAGNMVAGVFVVGLILDLCLPRDPSHYTSM